MTCIETTIPDHFVILFGDVTNEPLDEFHSGNRFFYVLFILVPVVMESNHFTIVFINAGSGNHRHSVSHLLATVGNVIHYDFIEKFICDLGEKYHILEIAVDRWNATHMIQNLEDAGYTMVPFGQGFASMSTPTKEFYRLLMEGQIVHAGHPVLRWMAGNVVIETDAAENIKVTKAKSKEKIDGIVASIMALDRCLRNQGEPQGSVYDERGLLIL